MAHLDHPGFVSVVGVAFSCAFLLGAFSILADPRPSELRGGPYWSGSPTITQTGPLGTHASEGTISFPNGCGNLPAVVSFQSNTTGGNPPYSYQWSFGDGTPNATQANPDHAYAAFGSYSVELKVSDALHESAYSNITAHVGAPPCTGMLETHYTPAVVWGVVAGIAVGMVAVGAYFGRRSRT
jgi:hypothetical protein